MMASRSAPISRQFNTPMKLYSPENVSEALSKQTQVLANGALGIDFHHLAAPGNLANSAVLRMLEEEAQKEGKENKIIEYSKPRRRVQRFDWPPKPGGEDVNNNNNNDQNNNNVNDMNKTNNNGFKTNCNFLNRRPFSTTTYNISTSPGLKRIAWPPLPDSVVNNVSNHQPVYTEAPANNYSHQPITAQKQNTWSPTTVPNNPLSPQRQQQQPIYPPQQPAYQQQQSQPIYQQPEQPIYQEQRQPSFELPPVQGYQDLQQPEPVFQRIVQTAAPIYEPVAAPVFEPPPSYVTLRQAAPVRQVNAPVFESQPAATRGLGPRMRGDQKWPPAENKAQAVAENEAREALARGPAVRPRRVKKDYSQFFAQNAITTTYPGYRAPPGTQHYVEEGTSNF